eukprot:1914531-Rhodomonas_salina.1
MLKPTHLDLDCQNWYFLGALSFLLGGSSSAVATSVANARSELKGMFLLVDEAIPIPDSGQCAFVS